MEEYCNAFQQGSHDAFYPSIEGRNPGLEGVCIDGISLTHVAAGSRQHIWTFATALYEASTSYNPVLVYVLAQTPTQIGHTKYLPSSETIISVTLAILDLPTHLPRYTKMILCGMVRGVILVAPAANSTTLLGSARHCYNPLPITLS